MSDRTFVYGGDNRTFDPDAGFSASRVQLYLNPSNGEWEVKWNSSKFTFGLNIVINDSSHVFRPNEDVQVDRKPDGSLEMTLKFYNNFCHDRSWDCPAIDARIYLEPDASKPGGFAVSVNRDGFPSMGIYRLKPDESGFITMVEDPEKIKNRWLNWIRLFDIFRNSVTLPEGCAYQ